MTPDQQQDRDRRRLVVLTMLRASGVVLMLAGIFLILRPWSTLPDFAGQLFFLIGVLASLVAPNLLAGYWRKQRD